MSAITLLVTADPNAAYLKALDRLPPDTRIIASADPAELAAAAPEADVILNGEFKDPQSVPRRLSAGDTRALGAHSLGGR